MTTVPRFQLVFVRGIALGAVFGVSAGALVWTPVAFLSIEAFLFVLIPAAIGGLVGVALGGLGGVATALAVHRRLPLPPWFAAAVAVAAPPVVVALIVTDTGRIVAFGFAAFVAIVAAAVSPLLLRPAARPARHA